MVQFAYVECELSIDEFYNLSFYEWGLEVERVRKRSEEKKIQWEGEASLFRELMALLANINRNPKKTPTPFEGSDFIKLSFDKPKEQYVSRKMTPEEVDAKAKKIEALKNKQNG
jgi:hypothetical protein